MLKSTPLLMRIMASSITAASRAGEIIRDVMSKGELGIVNKGIDDPQTEADRSAQKCIIGSLINLYPNLKVIGEEGVFDMSTVSPDMLVTDIDKEFLNNKCPDMYTNVKEEDLVVWVDPLDGTTEYTHGFLEHVTVLIGIALSGRAVGGVIHQPYYNNGSGRTIWGLKGLGTGGFDSVQLPTDKLIVATTRSHSNALVQSALEALKPDEVIKVGGAGFKILLLLEGKAHAYVFASAGCKKWDTCAPEAVIEAFGGVLTDMLGRHYNYGPTVSFPNKAGILATVPQIDHGIIVEKIPTHVKKALEEFNM